MSATETFYIAIGLLSVVAVLAANHRQFGNAGRAGATRALETAYYAFALAALLIGWYFNFEYLRQYGRAAGWWHWTTLLFVNPASASGGQDLIIANMLLFPLWTIVDSRHNGLRAGWW